MPKDGADRDRAVRRLVQSRSEQGLSATVDDPAALELIAGVLVASLRGDEEGDGDAPPSP